LESKQNEIIKIPSHYEAALNKIIFQIKSGNTISNFDNEESIEKWLYK